MSDEKEKAIERVKNLLSDSELDAYLKYVESGAPGLAPSKSAEFYSLFLQGHSCHEIARLNPAYGLGLIIKARVEHDWDGQKDRYVGDLLSGIREKVQKTQLEAISFASDGMAVFHKLLGEKFKKFLQSGDASVLGDFKDMSFKTYKELLENMIKLTGQGGDNKKVSGEVLHIHTVEQPVPKIDRPLSSGEAAEILKTIESKGKK